MLYFILHAVGLLNNNVPDVINFYVLRKCPTFLFCRSHEDNLITIQVRLTANECFMYGLINLQFPFSIMLPLILVRRVQVIDIPIPLVETEPMYMCSEVWPRNRDRTIYDGFLFVFMFIMPGCFVIVSYSRIGCQLWTEGQELYRNDSEVLFYSFPQMSSLAISKLLKVLL